MKALTAAFGVVFLSVLVACPQGAPKVIDLDNGGLHLVPVFGVTSRITRAQAAELYDYSSSFPAGPHVPILGRLTINVNALPGGLVARLKNVLAWVYVVPRQAFGVRCPIPRGPVHPSPTPTHPSNKDAFIVEADNGRVFTYVGAGPGDCGSYVYVPFVSEPRMRVSVPITFRDGVVRIMIPPCGSVTGYGPQGADAIVPFGVCNGKATVRVDHIPANVRFGLLPLHLGIWCGPAYDPAIPLPSKCRKV